MQLTVYQWLHDVPFGIWWYYNKNDSAMREYVRPFDFKMWRTIENKVLTVVKAVKLGTFPAKDVSYWACKDCKYDPICKSGTVDPEL
jgi:hypothetical protein